MRKINLIFSIFVTGMVLYSCNPGQDSSVVQVFPDSVITDVSHHPVGINLISLWTADGSRVQNIP